MSRRVVITGVGVVSALGVGRESMWRGLTEGRCGLAPLTLFDPTGLPCTIAGEAKEDDGSLITAKNYVPKHYRKAVKVMARDIELAVAAAKLAVDDAGLVTRATFGESSETPAPSSSATDPVGPSFTYPSERMGCSIGAGLIAAEAGEIAQAFDKARSGDGAGMDLRVWGNNESGGGGGGMNHLTPLWLLKYLPNMLACHVTIIHGAQGPSNTITCGESSALLSIGESVRVIERGSADMCFSGGAESKLNLLGVFRQGQAGRLADAGPDVDVRSLVRPFDESAGGMIMGEGGGILILELAEKAAARGAKVYAEVAGFGAGQSAAALPGLDGVDGYRYAVQSALSDAGVNAAEIDAIVPLGLGEPGCDAMEAEALFQVFGDQLESIPMVTLSPHVGNCHAGMGGLSAGVGAMLLAQQALPGRLGVADRGRLRRGVRANAEPGGPANLKHVLVCSASLGGQNAALVLRRTTN